MRTSPSKGTGRRPTGCGPCKYPAYAPARIVEASAERPGIPGDLRCAPEKFRVRLKLKGDSPAQLTGGRRREAQGSVGVEVVLELFVSEARWSRRVNELGTVGHKALSGAIMPGIAPEKSDALEVLLPRPPFHAA